MAAGVSIELRSIEGTVGLIESLTHYFVETFLLTSAWLTIPARTSS